MSFSAYGKYSLSLSINGIDTSPDNCLFNSMTIIQNTVIGIPVMELDISLGTSFIENNIIADGTKIQVTLSLTDPTLNYQEPTMDFRVYNYQISYKGEFYSLKASCVFDVPDFWQGIFESFNSTSYNVFQTFAGRNHLSFLGDQTGDKQVWIRPGIRGSQFLNDVCNRAWNSENSYFVYSICTDNVLRFFDLSRRSSSSSRWTAVPNYGQLIPSVQPNQILYGDLSIMSLSGTYNSFFGYGRNASNFDVSTGVFGMTTASTMQHTTKYLPLNNDLVNPQRTKFLPPNAGNTHDNYEKAIMQNMRYKSLYSVGVKLITEFPRSAQIFDRVTLSGKPLAKTTTSETYMGDYFITAVTTQLDSGSITRGYLLARDGLNPTDRPNLRG